MWREELPKLVRLFPLFLFAWPKIERLSCWFLQQRTLRPRLEVTFLSCRVAQIRPNFLLHRAITVYGRSVDFFLKKCFLLLLSVAENSRNALCLGVPAVFHQCLSVSGHGPMRVPRAAPACLLRVYSFHCDSLCNPEQCWLTGVFQYCNGQLSNFGP
jgi:hypothetical protein